MYYHYFFHHISECIFENYGEILILFVFCVLLFENCLFREYLLFVSISVSATYPCICLILLFHGL